MDQRDKTRTEMGISMKHNIMTILQYGPWLLLLLGLDLFSALLLWIADAEAFYSMVTVTVLATILLFFAVCCVLNLLEQKRAQAFSDFLRNPDEYHEELLQRTVALSQRESIRLLGRILRDGQAACTDLETQLAEYEEYIESWAHETKTPLSLLTFLLDNRKDELSASVNIKLDYIRNRMQESVNQVLFYARLKGTAKDYLFEQIPIRCCIEDVLEDYRPLLEEKQFQIRFCLSDDTVYSDRRGLQFLLSQIISNSIKYCSGTPELCFEASATGSCYVLSIRDNGLGVHSCDLPYLFEKGFTGSSGNDRSKATGMGLYLAKEMAEDLNLTLQADSEPGAGFTMRISFPVVKE